MKTLTTIGTLFMLGVLFSCENSMESIQEFNQLDTLPDMTAENIRYLRSDSARLQISLESPLMNRYKGEDGYTEFPEGFVIYSYDTLGVKTASIRADFGINYLERKVLLAQFDVVVENYETAEKLFTEKLIWDQKSRTIRAPQFVKIVSPEKTLFGDSLWANESFSKPQIFGVRGQIEVDEDAN